MHYAHHGRVFLQRLAMNLTFQEASWSVRSYRLAIINVILDKIVKRLDKPRSQASCHEERRMILWITRRNMPISVDNAMIVQDVRSSDEI